MTKYMKTNTIMNDIRSEMSPQMKKQMELSVAIANRIYDILEQKGLTQKQFAALVGKTETEVSRWLSGTHNMTVATIAKISTALGCDIIQPIRKPRTRSRNNFPTLSQDTERG